MSITIAFKHGRMNCEEDLYDSVTVTHTNEEGEKTRYRNGKMVEKHGRIQKELQKWADDIIAEKGLV